MGSHAESDTIRVKPSWEDEAVYFPAEDGTRYIVLSFDHGREWILSRDRRALRRSKFYKRGDWRYDESFPMETFDTKEAACASASALAKGCE